MKKIIKLIFIYLFWRPYIDITPFTYYLMKQCMMKSINFKGMEKNEVSI